MEDLKIGQFIKEDGTVGEIRHRVYFKTDGTIEVETVVRGYQETLGTSEEPKKPAHLKGVPCFLMTFSQVPKIGEIEDWAQLYHEDGKTLKVDKDWSVRLMPLPLIRKKFTPRICRTMEAELKKDSPNIPAIVKKMSEIHLCEYWDDKKWYRQAVKDLDDRMAEGEKDKPVIREKLKVMIS